jgi:hypothetical protein
MEFPLISFLISSTGRYEYLSATIESFLKHNTYPNIEFVIVESIPTEEAKVTFDLSKCQTDKCIEYIKNIQEHSIYATPIFYYQIPWMPMGNVMNYLFSKMHGDYYFWGEDDWLTVCDPKEIFLDGIQLMKDDPSLTGIRCVIEKEGYFTEEMSVEVRQYFQRNGISPQLYGVKRHPISDYIYWPLGGGTIFGDREKMLRMGTMVTNHPLKDFWWGETGWSHLLQYCGNYVGIMHKYYGFVVHIGGKSTSGLDRTELTFAGEQMIKDGRYGAKIK